MTKCDIDNCKFRAVVVDRELSKLSLKSTAPAGYNELTDKEIGDLKKSLDIYVETCNIIKEDIKDMEYGLGQVKSRILSDRLEGLAVLGDFLRTSTSGCKCKEI